MEAEPRRRGGALRRAEILAWTLGLALIALYFGIRARNSAAAKSELRRFEQLRAQASQPATHSAPPLDAAPSLAPALEPERPLSWSTPDQSLWSPERVRAWQVSETGSAAAPLAVLRIPKIHLEVPVLEGTDDVTLDRGAGHIEGTALPSSPGNLGIAGHRDGFFRGLKDIGIGDRIELETVRGFDGYVIENIWLVKPDDVWVLDFTDTPQLTLVTCYPFYYVGSAPQRYIVRASRVESRPH
jgi:sortase A